MTEQTLARETDQPDASDTDPPERDPSDPEAVAERIRQERATERADSERRYQRALADERLQTERRISEALQERDTAHQQDRQALEFSAVANALDAATRESELLQDQIAAAGAEGDFRKAAALNVQAGRVGARIEQLEAGKQQMEGRRNAALRPQQPQEREKPAAPPAPAADPIEDTLRGMDKEAAEWVRRQRDERGNMRFFADKQFYHRVVAADANARAEGIAINSPEYFAFVERNVGLTQANDQPQSRQQPRYAASEASPATPARSAAAYRDGATRGGDSAHIPSKVIDHCVRVMGFKGRDGKPDMASIADYWREHNRMKQAGEFKAGDPWAGAR